jgi:hypothetical protein
MGKSRSEEGSGKRKSRRHSGNEEIVGLAALAAHPLVTTPVIESTVPETEPASDPDGAIDQLKEHNRQLAEKQIGTFNHQLDNLETRISQLVGRGIITNSDDNDLYLADKMTRLGNIVDEISNSINDNDPVKIKGYHSLIIEFNKIKMEIERRVEKLDPKKTPEPIISTDSVTPEITKLIEEIEMVKVLYTETAVRVLGGIGPQKAKAENYLNIAKTHIEDIDRLVQDHGLSSDNLEITNNLAIANKHLTKIQALDLTNKPSPTKTGAGKSGVNENYTQGESMEHLIESLPTILSPEEQVLKEEKLRLEKVARENAERDKVEIMRQKLQGRGDFEQREAMEYHIKHADDLEQKKPVLEGTALDKEAPKKPSFDSVPEYDLNKLETLSLPELLSTSLRLRGELSRRSDMDWLEKYKWKTDALAAEKGLTRELSKTEKDTARIAEYLNSFRTSIERGREVDRETQKKLFPAFIEELRKISAKEKTLEQSKIIQEAWAVKFQLDSVIKTEGYSATSRQLIGKLEGLIERAGGVLTKTALSTDRSTTPNVITHTVETLREARPQKRKGFFGLFGI